MFQGILFLSESNFKRDFQKESEVKEELPKQEDPWAELPYTVDLETGKILTL